MESSSSPSWARWKAEAARTGAPVVPGAENEPESMGDEQPEPRFSFDEWRKKHPRRVRRPREDQSSGTNTKHTAVKKRQKTHPAAAHTAAQPAMAEAVDLEKVKEENEKRRAARKEARRAKLDAPRLAEEEAERRVALELLSKPSTGAAAVLP